MFNTASWHILSFRHTENSVFGGIYWSREETQTKTVAAEGTKVRARKRKADVAIVSVLKGSQTSMQMLFFIFQLHVDQGFSFNTKIKKGFVNNKTVLFIFNGNNLDNLYY